MNADRVRARVIVEAANGPVDQEADAILADRGVVVIPDVLASAGGVIVSYFEWLQNRSGAAWTLEEVSRHLRDRMVPAADYVWRFAEERKTTLRTSAYVLGLSRIDAAIAARGPRRYATGD
jgi:glutamate dehydrogenase/leucine dehydrogenase